MRNLSSLECPRALNLVLGRILWTEKSGGGLWRSPSTKGSGLGNAQFEALDLISISYPLRRGLSVV